MTNQTSSKFFAVVDAETNWNNETMSVGVVIGDAEDFSAVDKRYYVIHPECQTGGIYSRVLRDIDEKLITDCSRGEAIREITDLFTQYGVVDIFAYNAPFDCKCLSELNGYTWRDILPIAANRNYNGKLPDNCEYFKTGLLKRGRGLENVMRLIYFRGFTEHHNGLTDALDELLLMKLIGQPLQAYGKYNLKRTCGACAYSAQPPMRQRANGLLNDYRYVVDELCGGSVRLLDFLRETKAERNGDTSSAEFSDCFYLQCSRCGYKWSQDAESFFIDRKCPKCSK